MNLDDACDIYKDMKENPQLYGIRKRMRIAEYEYEYNMSEPYKHNNFEKIINTLRKENL